MPHTRSAAEAFSESEDHLHTASPPFATFESEQSEIDDDASFAPTTEDDSGDDPEFYDPEDLEIFEEVDDDEEDEDDDDDEEGNETEGEFQDAAEQSEGIQIEVSIDPDNARAGGTGIGAVRIVQPEGQGRPISVTRDQILRLLGSAGLRRLLQQHGLRTPLGATQDDDNETSEDDDISYGFGGRRRRRPAANRSPLPPVPSPAGQELMDSGTFGVGRTWQDELRQRRKRTARILMNRELGITTEQATRANQEIIQDMIPSSQADAIIHYNARCYSGQFSDDGNFFFSCAQDFKVRMYDTSNPYKWKYYKTVPYPYGQWTITDATLSPDNKHLAYSSIRSTVCLAVTDPNSDSDPYMLDFSDMGNGPSRGRRHQEYSHFGIWSIRFSGDGREIVAGTSDNSVYVYDIDANRSILRIPGHHDHVNAVCFGDTSSPHILYSGSDDTLIKVWDRRSMSDSREAGVFMGHTEGLTYVDSKGDGRYVLSNGKDQSMKLWDLRKMISTEDTADINPLSYSSGFDYRYMSYSDADYRAHPKDCSVVTYRGHTVLKTLIRCHFSPPNSTNSRYVYSGSENGKIHVYNMDATIAGVVDVAEATYESRPYDPAGSMATWDGEASRSTWKTCVRDASWHPNAPMIAATSWNGWGMSTGTCSIHTWNDGSSNDESGIAMGQRLNHKLEPDARLESRAANRASSVPRRRGLRSQAVDRQDEDDGEADIW